MDFPKFQRLVEDRTGFRTMDHATASGEYFSDSCGDMYNFFLKVGPGAIVEDISYFTTGCGFGTATCSLVVDLVRGKTIDEAARLSEREIEDELGGYPEKKKD
ncbi:MAG: iron-sulfur cluster assembly scaffold protein, partial [Vulcanimicrobiaceae bacterium]